MPERAVWVDETGPHSPLLLPDHTFWLNSVSLLPWGVNEDYYFRFFQIVPDTFFCACAFATYAEANQCPPMPFTPAAYPGLLAWTAVPLNVPIECWMPRNVILGGTTTSEDVLLLNLKCCSQPQTWHCVFGWKYPAVGKVA